MSITVMKHALEALEFLTQAVGHPDNIKVGEDAITALRQSIAEAEKQPQRQPLTDDEIQDIGRFVYCRGSTTEKLYQIMWNSQPSASIGWDRQELIAFARAIEADHGIGEKK